MKTGHLPQVHSLSKLLYGLANWSNPRLNIPYHRIIQSNLHVLVMWCFVCFHSNLFPCQIYKQFQARHCSFALAQSRPGQQCFQLHRNGSVERRGLIIITQHFNQFMQYCPFMKEGCLLGRRSTTSFLALRDLVCQKPKEATGGNEMLKHGVSKFHALNSSVSISLMRCWSSAWDDWPLAKRRGLLDEKQFSGQSEILALLQSCLCLQRNQCCGHILVSKIKEPDSRTCHMSSYGW